MEKNNCTNGHQYGLWQIENEKEVSRICLTCNYKQIYPKTSEVLKEYYPEPYEIYTLTRSKNMNAIEFIIDFFIGGSSPEMIFPFPELMKFTAELSSSSACSNTLNAS